MFQGTILYVPRSEAVRYAADYLSKLGLCMTTKPAPDVTHLLLPVPSFPNGDEYLAHILTDLPDDVIVSGGNLNSALLEHNCKVDFLQDPFYLAENAAITSRCAVEILKYKIPLPDCPILIMGWGRIGKCLGFELAKCGASVCIAARKTADLAMIKALGFDSIHIQDVQNDLLHFGAIVNTVPTMLLPNMNCRPDCICMELASKPGMLGSQIINARGLPGQMAPKESGKLIAETFIRLSL